MTEKNTMTYMYIAIKQKYMSKHKLKFNKRINLMQKQKY